MVPISRAARRKSGSALFAALSASLERRRTARQGTDDDAAAVDHTGAAGREEDAAPPASPTRSAPVLRWTETRTAPKTGAFAPCAVASTVLDAGRVPERSDAWEHLNEFALTYDGYAYWENLPELAQRALSRWTRDGSLPETLDELRGCLFYEQRRWHHFGDVPTGRSHDYVWALADAIRSQVRPAPLAAPAPVAVPAATTEGGPVSFLDDDEGYVEWTTRHPGGFVLNSNREPSARYMKLHRASCAAIAAVPGGGGEGRNWTVRYRKVCAPEIRLLLDWSSAHAGVEPDPCKRCRP
ncbi:MAG TPA: hypothetical protein VEI83_06305 [Acidimicrobiales bacterium]|nr:hypothetical protein [Acidimicrobiales bacterium]